MTPTRQRAVTGGAMGAAIGAGAGVLGGLIVDQHEQSKQRAYDQGYYDGRNRR